MSHHPPMLAQHCEGAAGWRCWQEFTMTTKFRGKYLQVVPLGGASAEFLSSGNKYTWRKVHAPPGRAVAVPCNDELLACQNDQPYLCKCALNMRVKHVLYLVRPVVLFQYVLTINSKFY